MKTFVDTLQGALLFLLVVLAAEIAMGQNQDTPQSAKILSVQSVGGGCEADQTAVSFSPDFQALSVLFSNLQVELGAGTAQPLFPAQDKQCQLQITIETPPGWSLGIKSADYRGYAFLPAGATARHRLFYMSPGMPPAYLREAALQGPLDQDYFYRLEQPVRQRPYTPCGNPHIQLRIGSHLSLRYPVSPRRGPNAPLRETAILSLDSIDMELKQDLQLEWKRCGRNSVLR